MTRVRKILITSLVVLTANSAALLAGCDRRHSLSYSGDYGSGGSYLRSTSYHPAQVYSPSRTVYISSGSLYYPGTISYTRIQSYPKVYRPLVIRRGYPYIGRHSSSGHSRGSRGHR